MAIDIASASIVLDPITRMTRDVAKSTVGISKQEVRFLVDYYYLVQEDRKRANNQVAALQKSQEPSLIVQYLADQATVLEAQVKRALDKFTDAHPVGHWMKSIYGIGPVLSAGLLAELDITKAPTAGHFWSFAGMNPNQKWEKGQKRPFNAELKKRLWLMGQCFMKFSGREDCYYGQMYKEKKAEYIAKNDAGEYKEQAAEDLASDKYKQASYAKRLQEGDEDGEEGVDGAEAFKRASFYLLQGKLPPGQIDARARRWAVKLFLAHLHEVMYFEHYKEKSPAPYAIAFMGHAHKIEPPNQNVLKDAMRDLKS
jgi:hypothetical protein